MQRQSTQLLLILTAILASRSHAPEGSRTCEAADTVASRCSAGSSLYPNGTTYWKRPDGLFGSPVALTSCGGGWRCAADAQATPLLQPPPDGWPETSERARTAQPQEPDSYCGVAVLYADDSEALDTARFASTFRNKEPVIIRSRGKAKAWLGKGKKARAQSAKFSRERLVKRAGRETGLAGISHDVVKSGGNGYIPYALADYFNKFMPQGADEDRMSGEPFCIFQREDTSGGRKTWAAETGSLLTPPPGNPELFPTPLDGYNMIWLIGPPRSGTAFHAHTEAWTALAHGRKRWLFYPPTSSPPAGGSGPDTYPTFAITHWWDQVRPLLPQGARPIECVQEPGDLMYVPEGWHHAVINAEDAVGISFQNSTCKNSQPTVATTATSNPMAWAPALHTCYRHLALLLCFFFSIMDMGTIVDSGGNFATVLHDALCRENSCDGDRWQQYSDAQKDSVLAGRQEAVAMADQVPYTHHALGEALLFSKHARIGRLEEAVQSYDSTSSDVRRSFHFPVKLLTCAEMVAHCIGVAVLLYRYSKALDIDPLLGASAVGLARTYFVMRQQPKAEELLRRLIDAAPLNAHFRKMYEKLILSQGAGRPSDGDKYSQRRLRDIPAYERLNFDLERLVADDYRTV